MFNIILTYFNIESDNMNYDNNLNINITNLRFEVRNVGRFVKESKTIYTWDFTLNSKTYKVELEHSKITGKRKVILNGKQLVKDIYYTYEFTFSFHIDKHFLTIIQLSPVTYDLRIDNLCFKGLIYNMYRQKEAKQDNKVIINTNKHLQRNDDAFFASDENTFDNTSKQQQQQQYFDVNEFEFCN